MSITFPILNNNKPSQPNLDNIASLINPDTIRILNSSIKPKAFGDQLLNNSKQQTVAAVRKNKLFELYAEKASLIAEEIELDINHRLTLEKLEQQNRPQKQVDNNRNSPTYGNIINVPPKLSNKDYERLVAIESGGAISVTNSDGESETVVYAGNYPTAKRNLEKRKKENEQAIKNILRDREEKRKARQKERKNKKLRLKIRIKKLEREALKNRLKAIFGQIASAKKDIGAILIVLLVGEIEKAIAQNERISNLVDSTNKIIEEANISQNPVKLKDAIIRRDNAIKVIEENERKIQNIVKQIDTLNVYINIFNGIVTVLTSIPIPTAVPPGIGIPINVIMKLVQTLLYISDILSTLTAYIPDAQTSLNNVIGILNEQKARLLNVNNFIENAASSSFSNNVTTPSDITPVSYGSDYPPYKGFTFALKRERDNVAVSSIRGDENTPVRHFAVAINRVGIEVLKSESSFTLDPNDLIEQLKITIDQRGLQG